MFPTAFHNQLKATCVRPRGCALALTDIKAKDCIFAVFDPDTDDFAFTLKTCCCWRECLLVPTPLQECGFVQPTVTLQFACSRSLGSLPTRDDWSYQIDGFAPEVYPQILSATSSILLSLIKEDGVSCMDSKIYGHGPKHSKSLPSYFQYAPVKVDDSQFFTYMGPTHGALVQWRYLDSPSFSFC